jgi:PTH1 family peptidyl-tRNA hydrolase
MDRALIVGLGNPGPRYANNRHNVGFMVVDQLARDAGTTVSRAKFKGHYATANVAGQPVALLKPQTFMNLSGQSVSPARTFFNVPNQGIFVIHDEIDLPYGTVKLKVGGGHAGHNGLRSLIAQLGGRDFVRLRVGVGRPAHGAVADFVLSDFSKDEREWLPDLLDRSVDAIRLALFEGPQKAMNQINQRAARAKNESS